MQPVRIMGGPQKIKDHWYLVDGDLVSLIELGDPEALAVLYDRHSQAAYSVALRMMRQRQNAEDLVQEAFLKVWRSAGNYQTERGSTRNWILSMVHSGGIDRLRSAATKQRTRERFEVLAAKEQPSEAFAETWAGLVQVEMCEALETLPSEQFKVLELAYYHGHTHTDIAELLELPLGTVKSRVRLGLKKMEGYLRSSGGAILS